VDYFPDNLVLNNIALIAPDPVIFLLSLAILLLGWKRGQRDDMVEELGAHLLWVVVKSEVKGRRGEESARAHSASLSHYAVWPLHYYCYPTFLLSAVVSLSVPSVIGMFYVFFYIIGLIWLACSASLPLLMEG